MMKKTRQSRKLREKISDGRQQNTDTISGLPESILCHILSFLPTNSSVATSILARRWRFLWTDVPALDIRLDRGNRDAVNRLISLPKFQNITTFRLDYYQIYGELSLPDSLFPTTTLVEFRLRFFYVPECFAASFPRLKKLHLNLFYYHCYSGSDDFLHDLLPACPVLEEFIFERTVYSRDTLCCCVSSPTLKRLTLSSRYRSYLGRGMYTVEINAPSLRYLFLEDLVSDNVNVVFGELTSLIEADITLWNREAKEDGVLHSCSMLEFLGRLRNVHRLKFSYPYLKALDSALSAWAVKFHNLTKLELATDWRLISMFLASADNLQVLIVGKVSARLKCWMEPQKVPTCLLSHLKTVKIDEFECTNDVDFELVRYLLRNAKALIRMEIHTQQESVHLQGTVKYGVDLEKRSEALQRISLFERGSEACTLAFD